ncbi:hypothetical protein WM40_22740 [Robbsia andropogonis]|uniref:Uncharacterized protein n=1 Tax=Robbsia andropogonis TaxID=28092 RepID=A0A0F5JUP5_9BURK|nr:hypothetical protein [Robbsia andropogonis]KKB61556.1 hypothetical protein WM40_22740 [Robbsia andropogonis]
MSTISRYAIIEEGVVTNVILWDGQGDLFPGMTVVLLPDDSPVSPGWTTPDDGKTFVAPPPQPQPSPL